MSSLTEEFQKAKWGDSRMIQMNELEDLRDLRRLIEAWKDSIDPPPEKMVGSMATYVVAKDAVLMKLKEIRVKYPVRRQPK